MNNVEVRDGSTLSIGVTGHRRLSDVERLERGVDTALEHIKEVFPRTSWRIMSSLAEGADRLVVHRAIRSGIRRLVVSLPLPRDEYLKDFDSQESRKEFLQLVDTAEQVREPSPTQTRADAYAAAGAFVLDHSDALVAIWDGKEAQGQGGTADIVAKARLKGLPIAWVHAGNRAPLTDRPNSLGSEQGVVTFENFESPAASLTERVTGQTSPDNPLDKLEDALNLCGQGGD